ncbi:MAG: hypothetical protein H6737_15820 [Alphaproteobacteria bacterium]|nr:hypothetical protein [Alphaproteobacteria bacterium]
MDPLDAPSPLGLINRQDELESGPTLAPDDVFEAEASWEDDDAWEDAIEGEFFSTLEPAPPRDDEDVLVVQRSRLPALVFAGLGAMVVAGGLALAVLTAFSGAEGSAERALPPVPVEVVDVAPVETPPVEAVAAAVEAPVAIVYPRRIAIADIGEADGDAPRRRSWRAKKPAAKPAPMRVTALPPLSVSALPPAE